MLRIAHVISSLAPQFGGPTFVAAGVSRALARRGHQVHLLTTNRGGLSPDVNAILADGVGYRAFDELLRAYAYAPGLSEALSSLASNLDLIHIHGLYLFPTIAAGNIGQRFGVPYIIRTTGALDPYHLGRKKLKKAVFDYFIQDKVLRHAAAFHYTTDLERNISEPYARGRPGIVIPNGLDLTPLASPAEPGLFRRRFPEMGDRRIVLFLGRINYKKGFEVLIPAFAELLKSMRDIHLVIAGNDDGHLNAVNRLLAETGISDAASVVGFLEGHEKYEAFADSSIFVLPSYSENFANALFEALGAGLPAVISDKVNTWPEIQAAGAGIVVEPQVPQLVDAMQSLLSDEQLRTTMATRATAFARNNYSWDSVVVKLEEAYTAILSRTAPPIE